MGHGPRIYGDTMTRRESVLVVLILAVLLAVSTPVEADDQSVVDEPSCVKFKTDPPSVVIDYGCIIEFVESVPPEP